MDKREFIERKNEINGKISELIRERSELIREYTGSNVPFEVDHPIECDAEFKEFQYFGGSGRLITATHKVFLIGWDVYQKTDAVRDSCTNAFIYPRFKYSNDPTECEIYVCRPHTSIRFRILEGVVGSRIGDGFEYRYGEGVTPIPRDESDMIDFSEKKERTFTFKSDSMGFNVFIESSHDTFH